MEIETIETEQKRLIQQFCNNYTANKIQMNDSQTMNQINTIIKKFFDLEIEKIKKDKRINFDEVPAYLKNIKFEIVDEEPRIPTTIGAFIDEGVNSNECYSRFYKKNFYSELNKDDEEDRKYGVLNMFIEVLHELEHYKQRLSMHSEPVTKETLQYSKDFLLTDVYEGNYFSNSLETGAYSNSMAEMGRILGDDEYVDGFNENMMELSELHDLNKKIGRFRYEAMLQPRDIVRQKKLDKIFTQSNRYENSAQALQNDLRRARIRPIEAEYDIEEFRRLTPKEICIKNIEDIEKVKNDNRYTEQEKNEIMKDVQEAYYGILSRELQVATQEELKEFEQEYGRENIEQLFSQMENYFENEKNIKINSAIRKAEILKNRENSGKNVPKELKVDNPNVQREEEIQCFTRYYGAKKQLLQRVRQEMDMEVQNVENQNTPNEQQVPDEQQIPNEQQVPDEQQIQGRTSRGVIPTKREAFEELLDLILENENLNEIVLTKNKKISPRAKKIAEIVNIKAAQRGKRVNINFDENRGYVMSFNTRNLENEQQPQQEQSQQEEQDQETDTER